MANKETKYRQVYDYLTQYIAENHLQPDDKLPTETKYPSISKSAEPQSDVHLENWLKTILLIVFRAAELICPQRNRLNPIFLLFR